MTQNSKRPSHDAFVVEGDGDRANWTKIGAAWSHDDGNGFNLQLSALPLNGRIVIRKQKPKTGNRNEEAR